MHIGIVGRHPSILDAAIATAKELGHTAVGTTADDVALQWLSERKVSALVIGGGVERPSRTKLIQACAERGVHPIEVFGPDKLRATLAALLI
jgi:hypothetical protein